MGEIGKNGSTTQSSWTKKVTVFLTEHSCLVTQHNNARIVGSIKIWMWSSQNGTKPNKTCNPYGDTVNEIILIAFQVGCQASKIGAASCSSMILINLGSTAQDVQASFPSFAGQLPKLVLLHILELPTKKLCIIIIITMIFSLVKSPFLLFQAKSSLVPSTPLSFPTALSWRWRVGLLPAALPPEERLRQHTSQSKPKQVQIHWIHELLSFECLNTYIYNYCIYLYIYYNDFNLPLVKGPKGSPPFSLDYSCIHLQFLAHICAQRYTVAILLVEPPSLWVQSHCLTLKFPNLLLDKSTFFFWKIGLLTVREIQLFADWKSPRGRSWPAMRLSCKLLKPTCDKKQLA